MDSERRRGLMLIVVSFLLAGGMSAALLRVDQPEPEQVAIQATVVPTQPTSAPATSTPPISDGTLYEVQPGDTLFAIAQQHDLTVETILAVNAIDDPAQIFAGQTLTLPAGVEIAALPSPSSLSPSMTPTFTITPVPPSVTPTFTITPLPPTVTPTSTATPIPSTATPTLTLTPVPATFTVLPPTPTPLPTATATIRPTATPTMTPEGLYEVLPDDTLYRIARLHNVDVELLISLNDISDPSQIFAGQMLSIPDATAVAPLPTATIDMTVLLPTPAPMPQTVNGLALETLIVMPEQVRRNVREIFLRGQTLGRNPRAFSKIGDSTIENPHFLARFDSGPYNLGTFGYLQPVIDQYPGSFSRQGMAVRRGMHSWSIFDPMWAGAGCLAGETPIDCEFRLHNPSLVIIRLGSNDVGVPRSFERNLRRMVQQSIEMGIVPIIGTKADRHEGSNSNNEIMRQVAADYAVPLWDYDLMAATIPGRGLTWDGVHMTTFFAHDWSSPVAFQRGHGAHSITALMALDAVWRVAMGE